MGISTEANTQRLGMRLLLGVLECAQRDTERLYAAWKAWFEFCLKKVTFRQECACYNRRSNVLPPVATPAIVTMKKDGLVLRSSAWRVYDRVRTDRLGCYADSRATHHCL